MLLDVAARIAPGQDSAAAVEVADAARLLRGSGWGVVTARPDTAMGMVWSQLCHTGTRGGALTVPEGGIS